MATVEMPHHEVERRAGLLMARFATLSDGNPGFHYDWHMRGFERDGDDADSVTSALVAGDRIDALRRLVSDDQNFQIWRLRLEHPMWWIGTRVRSTTSLLAQIISELDDDEPLYGFHTGLTGYAGAHWFNQTKEAIKPLSKQSRQKLAAALRRERLGRQLCMSAPVVEEIDIAQEFPESEFDTAIAAGADLTAAFDAVAGVHGRAWADAFATMLSDLDPITWASLAEALAADGR